MQSILGLFGRFRDVNRHVVNHGPWGMMRRL